LFDDDQVLFLDVDSLGVYIMWYWRY